MRQILPVLNDILCHPDSKEKVVFNGTHFVAPNGDTFPMIDGIPVFQSRRRPLRHRIWEWVYNRTAFSYDFGVQFAWRFSFGGAPIRRESYLSRLEISQGSRVLETAVGTGDNLLELPADAEYIGIDQSFGMLRQCQRKLGRKKRFVGLIQADMASLPFTENSFDHVFHVGGLQFMDNPAKGINEMHRVARTGAKITLVDEQSSLSGMLNRSNRNDVAQLIPPDITNLKIEPISDGELFLLQYVKSGPGL